MEHFPEVGAKLTEMVEARRPIYTMRNCLRAVCLHYDVPPEEIKMKDRSHRLVIPRQHFCWVVYRNRIDISYPMIGRFIGRDHTTVVHSVAKFEVIRGSMTRDISAVDQLIHNLTNQSNQGRL